MRQSATNVMMVRPASFQFNHETAQSNEFQNNIEDLSREDILRIAQTEFDTMVTELTSQKINVLVIHDTVSPENQMLYFLIIGSVWDKMGL